VSKTCPCIWESQDKSNGNDFVASPFGLRSCLRQSGSAFRRGFYGTRKRVPLSKTQFSAACVVRAFHSRRYGLVSPPIWTTQYLAGTSPTFLTVWRVPGVTRITPPWLTLSDLPSCSKSRVPSTTTITSVCWIVWGVLGAMPAGCCDSCAAIVSPVASVPRRMSRLSPPLAILRTGIWSNGKTLAWVRVAGAGFVGAGVWALTRLPVAAKADRPTHISRRVISLMATMLSRSSAMH
jgi:hypothetical protein